MEIINDQDTIDSRDVIERIEELKGLCALSGYSKDFLYELHTLKDVCKQGEASPDWEYGEILIRESYFKEYAEELAEEVDSISEDTLWPYNHINWEQAANKLKFDYFGIDFDGVTYWIWS